jgi:hypothetical protein
MPIQLYQPLREKSIKGIYGNLLHNVGRKDEELRQLVIDMIIQRYVKWNVDPVLPTPATGRNRRRRFRRHRSANCVRRFRGGRREGVRYSRCNCRLLISTAQFFIFLKVVDLFTATSIRETYELFASMTTDDGRERQEE